MLSDDKETSLWASSVQSAVLEELRAQGFYSVEEYTAAVREHEERLAISDEFAKSSGLSPTAIAALREMVNDYDFGEGSSFFGNVCLALGALPKLAVGQRSLRKQLEALSVDERKALGVALWKRSE
ncbi:MAG: hypothetical protein ACRD3D_07420 [Terriglobia bacterium]